MQLRNTSTTYGAVSKFFHWLIFLLVLAMLIFGYFLDDVPKEYKAVAYNLHKLTGLTILLLMLLRLMWALTNSKPLLPAETSCWQRGAERIVHGLLYAALIGMPLAGWIGAVAGEKPPHLGDFQFNLPIAPSKALKNTAFDIHGYLAITIIVLVSVHALAALYHHFIKKDNILKRMLPWVSTQ